ncbi:MAG: hypothetical protein RIQ93_1118 [Verrucomicrobiota bacterium]|jgi:N-acetylglucosamine kinase-like BadF-type ATPase
MCASYKIGVDGGGTKTEFILVDATGAIVARQLAAASNPNVVGAPLARRIVTEALHTLRARVPESTPAIAHTHLYMAGSRAFWLEVAGELKDFGAIGVFHDALPVLELATGGEPGLVLHAGTGSFVAGRGPDGAIHYAGGVGWRFGDPGSGYDLGRRAVARALLELQGWATPTRMSPAVRAAAGLGDAADAPTITRYFYQHAEPNRVIAALSPVILGLASEGDETALQLVVESAGELLALAHTVAVKLFPGAEIGAVKAGLSGPILTQAVVTHAFAGRSALALTPVVGTPIDGIQRLLARLK